MKRLLIHFNLALLLTTGFASSAAAAGSPIANAMNDLRWGMNEYELTLFLQSRIKSVYAAKIKKASGSEKHRLEQEAQARLKEIQSGHVEFNGRSTRWDSGLIAYEFTHSNDETMLMTKDDNSTNFYFLINNSLWKWYKAFNRDAFRGKNFKQVSATLEKNFGEGIRKEAERVPGAGMRPVLEWRDRNTRVRAIDESAEHDRFCLVFEDVSIMGQIAGMRVTPDRRFAKLRAAKAKPVSEEPAAEPRQKVASKEKPAAANAKSKKSVFAQEQESETEQQYQTRRQRILEQQAAANRQRNEQKVAAKRAKELEGLKSLEDNDPLGGL